jgi:ribosomal protein S6
MQGDDGDDNKDGFYFFRFSHELSIAKTNELQMMANHKNDLLRFTVEKQKSEDSIKTEVRMMMMMVFFIFLVFAFKF